MIKTKLAMLCYESMRQPYPTAAKLQKQPDDKFKIDPKKMYTIEENESKEHPNAINPRCYRTSKRNPTSRFV